jgi:DNA-binding PadR family transcriptional regulator
MRSLVNWALLGLVIDRPSYAYELAQRFEREYRDALSLSSVSHVYTALGALNDRGLVEELAGTRGGRQPKPHYRATPEGIKAYQDWLVGQVAEERQRQRLFVLALGALERNPQAALEIITRYEERWLELAGSFPIRGREDTGGTDLTERLIAEEGRLSVGARLSWAQYARQEFKALATARAQRR